MTQNFYYVTKGAPSASQQAFIDFARGTDPTVQDAFANLGFYPNYSYK